MMLLDRASGVFEDAHFRELPSRLRGDELIVVNNARVIPARLFAHRLGTRAESVGKHSRGRNEDLRSRIEVLLARRITADLWETLVRPASKVRKAQHLIFACSNLESECVR